MILNKHCSALISSIFVFASGSLAATNEVSFNDGVYLLETVFVQAKHGRPLSVPIGQDELLENKANHSIAHAAQSVPGASGACRSIDAPEISIRGLGWERVPAQLDFLPLYGSCPARMDPPATYISPETIADLTIIKGLPSVTYGAGGTGGRVMARTVSDPTQPALDGLSANTSASWNEARKGWSSRAGAAVGNGKAEIGISANAVHLGDYTSGDGKEVPADNRSHGASAKVRITPHEDHGFYASWNLHKVDHLDYPALPMDATDVNSQTFTAGGKHRHISKKLDHIEWQIGYANSSHLMDNALKPTQPLRENEADTESETYGARIATGWNFSEDHSWILGIDAHHLSRNGTRTRLIKVAPPAPGTYQDPIWPDAAQGQLGLFIERATELPNHSRLRIGLRTDAIFSGIDRSDELTPFFGDTVGDSYARYYGESARNTDREELLISGNVLWEIPQTQNCQWFIGAGVVQRAASITERFYAYAPAPGGFQVGNPDLDPETKAELDGGVEFHSEHVELGAHLFAAHVWDFIYETAIGTAGNGASIRGFQNTEALLVGGELDGRIWLSDQWSLPFDLAYTRGRNLNDHRDLPLIAPLNGRVALRWDSPIKWEPWAEAEIQAATTQHDIDTLFPETETSAYQVLNLRGGIALPGGIGLEAGVENLLDQDYANHLSRATLFATGDLSAGQRVPMPGRTFFAGINWSL